MLIKNLLGLSFEQAQQVEQKNHWLYIFSPGVRKIFLVELDDATGPLVIRSGYEQVTRAPPTAIPSTVERGS